MIWQEHLESDSPTELERLATLPPHEILGVPETASRKEIQFAYRDLVKVYHPDVADPFMRAHNLEVIKIINRAYASLLNGGT